MTETHYDSEFELQHLYNMYSESQKLADATGETLQMVRDITKGAKDMIPKEDPFINAYLAEQKAKQDWFLKNYRKLLNRQQLVDTGALEDEIDSLSQQVMAQQGSIEHLEESMQSITEDMVAAKHSIDILNKQKSLVRKALELADRRALNDAVATLSQQIAAQEVLLEELEGAMHTVKCNIKEAKQTVTNLNKQKIKEIRALEAAPAKNAKITMGAKKLADSKRKYVTSSIMKNRKSTNTIAKKLAKALNKIDKSLFAPLPETTITDYSSKDQLITLNNYLLTVQPLLPSLETKYRQASDLAKDQLANIYAFHRRDDPVPSDSDSD